MEFSEQQRILNLFPIPDKKLSYGTAGFRDPWNNLHSTFIRMGILSSLRSSVNGGLYVGTVITASHNMVCDNGIKIIDYDGGMLSQEWEPLAEEISRIASVEELHAFISRIVNNSGSSLLGSGGCVLIGRDTRPHSKELAECVKLGVQVAGGTCIDFGELTTPQLHFIVSRSNQLQVPRDSFNIQGGIDDYFNTLSTGYASLISTSLQQEKTHIIIDGSFGIGGRVVQTLSESINGLNPNLLEIDVRNRVGEGDVNEGCGAEIVQKERRPPCGVGAGGDANRLLCSFDGDGDRIVFHAFLPNPLSPSHCACTWSLIDGDKIASLLAVFLCEEMKHANLDKSFSIGLVQTAYANGASRNFMISKGLNPVMAKTGVKFLHHKATHFDMGLYFEANGHGTVLFSKSLITAIERGCDDAEDDRVKIAFTRLQASLKVINQCVGDVMSDMLLCLAALQILNISLVEWNDLYTDYPSKQIKIPVGDKNSIQCSQDETRVVQPCALQEKLDLAMACTSNGRCFVRPSGTENCVRVYAEAATQELADALALQCIDAIQSTVS